MSRRVSLSEQARAASWLAANLNAAALRRLGTREAEAEYLIPTITAMALTLAWLERNADRIRGAFGKTGLDTDGTE